jgi:hypothetical protein
MIIYNKKTTFALTTVPPKPLAMPNVPSMIIYNKKTTFALTTVPPKPKGGLTTKFL